MGLFDTSGGGMDWDSILSAINPMGTANANEALGPNGAPMAAPTADQLLQSRSATSPINTQTPFVTPGATSTGIPPTDGRGNDPIPPNNIVPINSGAALAPVVTPPPSVPLTSGDGSVGAALTGGPVSLPPSAAGTSGATDISARAKTPERPSLAQALKGVVAPKPPELQKISSPNAPRPTGTIKGGDLLALLTALNAGGAKTPRLGG